MKRRMTEIMSTSTGVKRKRMKKRIRRRRRVRMMTRIKEIMNELMNGRIRGRISSGLTLKDDSDTDQLMTLL